MADGFIRFLVRLRPELLLLAAAAALTRFWHLTSPRAFVFDEVYYEPFAGAYLTHSYIFDVHPPLGRLLFAATARLLGVPAAALMQPVPVPSLRILSALFGTLLVPLAYVLLRQLGASRRVATLGAAAILFDNGLLMSRVAVPDIMLIVFSVGAMSCYLAARMRDGRARLAFMLAAAVLAGLALSIKWTGASALGLILSALVCEGIARRVSWTRLARDMTLLVAIPAVPYLGFFQLQFALLTHSGSGDRYMPPRFLAQLPGSASYDPRAPKLSYWQKLADVHAAINRSNGKLIGATNTASSPWYTWPFTTHPIMVWSSTQAGATKKLFLVGNPLVWWSAIAGVVATLGLLVAQRTRFVGYQYGTVFLLAAFAINYLPFIAIRRIMYIYHYLFALTMAAALLAWTIGLFSGWMTGDTAHCRFATRKSAVGYVAIIAAWATTFLFFAQFSYP